MPAQVQQQGWSLCIHTPGAQAGFAHGVVLTRGTGLPQEPGQKRWALLRITAEGLDTLPWIKKGENAQLDIGQDPPH